MKKCCFLFPAVLMFMLLTEGCSEKKSELAPTEPPVLEFPGGMIVQALAEGGVYELAYTIKNPVEGVEAQLIPDQDWISGCEVLSDKVLITVDPNDGNVDRNASILFVYDYGEDEVLEEYLTVHQVYAYDYNTAATYINAGYFYGRGVSEANYAIYLSDKPTVNGSFDAGSTVYRLDIKSSETPADYASITLPDGTYTIDNLDIYNSFWGQVNAAGDAWELYGPIADMTVNISHDEENTVIDGVITDEDGKLHRVSYNGPAEVSLYSAEGYGLINFDIELVDPFLSDISYVDGNDEVMAISMQISGTPEDNDYMNPFSSLYVELYAPYDDYGLLPGIYTIAETQAANTLWPGYVDPSTLSVFGTYAIYSEGAGSLIALASSGTIEVSEGADGIYTVDVDLYTAQGFRISGIYTGEMVIDNIPGSYFSTLEDDYTVRMEEIYNTFGSYYGDEYGTGGGHFTLEMTGTFEQDPNSVLTQGIGEFVNLDIVSSSMDYEAGPASGTYTVAEDPAAPKPGEFLPGTRAVQGMNVLSGTYYTGGYENGYVNIAAPAVGGTLNLTNHGDGTYTIDFDFKDDRDNTWSGDWTGELSFMDWTWLYGQSLPNYVERRMALSEKIGEAAAGNGTDVRDFNVRTFPDMK